MFQVGAKLVTAQNYLLVSKRSVRLSCYMCHPKSSRLLLKKEKQLVSSKIIDYGSGENPVSILALTPCVVLETLRVVQYSLSPLVNMNCDAMSDCES